MTLQVKEFDLLVSIWKHLNATGERPDLASALMKVLNRTNAEREKAWARRYEPHKISDDWKERLDWANAENPLMKMLLEAGCPESEMDHHESDLYVYVTPLTTRVVNLWCRRHGFDRTWHCPTFVDQTSGRLMYDCAFQYTPWTSAESQEGGDENDQ